MKAIYGLFAGPDEAQRAVDALRRAGIADGDITVISDEPFEEYEFSRRDKATWLFQLAGAGGVVGLASALVLTTGTERAWPLATGGMPIVAFWPNLVIIFELTMLGAILTTVVSLLVTAKLPTRRQPLYDPEVSNGRVLVGVAAAALRPPEAIRRALEAAGTLVVRTIE